MELLTSLGSDNPRFAPHLLNRTLAVLGSRSANCACTAARAVKFLLPEAHPTQRRPGDEVTELVPPPMGGIVGAAMGLLRHRDEEVRFAHAPHPQITAVGRGLEGMPCPVLIKDLQKRAREQMQPADSILFPETFFHQPRRSSCR